MGRVDGQPEYSADGQQQPAQDQYYQNYDQAQQDTPVDTYNYGADMINNNQPEVTNVTNVQQYESSDDNDNTIPPPQRPAPPPPSYAPQQPHSFHPQSPQMAPPQGSYPTQQGQPQPQAYPPQGQPQAYPPQQGQQQSYPPQQAKAQAYPPEGQPQAYPPQQGQPQAYPPKQGQPQAYPPQQGQPQAYPPQQGFFEAQAQQQTYTQPNAGYQQGMPGTPNYQSAQNGYQQGMQGMPGTPNKPIQGFPMAQPVGTERWNSDLFDCMDDPENALITACFPCVTFGQIAEILDNGATPCATSGLLYGCIAFLIGCPCIMSCGYRSKLRTRYQLIEAPAPDWLTHCLCEWCALCQEYRELKSRDLDPALGWQGNLARQQQIQMQQAASMMPPMNQTMMG